MFCGRQLDVQNYVTTLARFPGDDDELSSDYDYVWEGPGNIDMSNTFYFAQNYHTSLYLKILWCCHVYDFTIVPAFKSIAPTISALLCSVLWCWCSTVYSPARSVFFEACFSHKFSPASSNIIARLDLLVDLGLYGYIHALYSQRLN